jgi:type IV pilus assembly protein PilV
MKTQHDIAARGLAPRRTRDTGFSLVEVMVALIVMSVGLLGIAKMQALALSSTTTSRMRSLVALEAASIASTMRADRAYWSAETASPLTVKIANGAVTSANDPTLQAAVTTMSATPQPTCPSCTTPQIAAADLVEWAGELKALAPGATSVVTCTPPPAATPLANPVSCQIVISWTETLVASNTQQAAQQALAGAPPPTTYTIYVDP